MSTDKKANMKKQLDECNGKIDRLASEIDDIEKTFNDKEKNLKEAHEKKIAYYKKCMEDMETKFNDDMEVIKEKKDSKIDKRAKEIVKSQEYLKVIKKNIANLK
jgi:peptidoglycan hydrolase CwlO-like protein